MNLSKPIPIFFKWKDTIRQIYWVIPAPLTSKHCYPIMSTLLYIEMQSEKALMLTRNNIQFWLDQILSLKKKKKKSSQGIYCLLKIPHQVPGNSSTSAGWLQKDFHFNSATSWSCHVPSWLPGSCFVWSPPLCSVSDSLATRSSVLPRLYVLVKTDEMKNNLDFSRL